MGRNLTTPRAPIRRSRIQMGERPIGDIDEVDVVTERTDFRIQMSEEPENSLVILT